MENKKAIIWSAGAALVAVVAFFLYVHKAVDRQIGDQNKRELILVATQEIPAGTRLEEFMFVEREWPTAYVPKGTAKSSIEVLGQEVLASIREGEPIMMSKLIPFDESSLDRRIPEGYRAVTIGIRDDQDVVGVAGHLRPGHFVDVLLTLFVNTQEIEKGAAFMGQAQNLKAETRTIFQNVKILAVGRDARLRTANVSRADPMEENLTNKNITVAMKPDEVQKLVLAQSTGRITLSLRRFNDTSLASLDYLDPFRAFGIKLPVVPGPAPAYREIRGGQVFATPY